MADEGHNAQSSEIIDFFKHLGSLYGILGSLSVVFPLANEWIQVIPLKSFDPDYECVGLPPLLEFYPGPGTLVNFPPSVVSILTTVFALFAMLFAYGRRTSLTNQSSRARLRRESMIFMTIGAGCFLVYVALSQVILESFRFDYYCGSGLRFRALPFDLVLIATYICSVVFVAVAFEILAMVEYFGERRQ